MKQLCYASLSASSAIGIEGKTLLSVSPPTFPTSIRSSGALSLPGRHALIVCNPCCSEWVECQFDEWVSLTFTRGPATSSVTSPAAKWNARQQREKLFPPTLSLFLWKLTSVSSSLDSLRASLSAWLAVLLFLGIRACRSSSSSSPLSCLPRLFSSSLSKANLLLLWPFPWNEDCCCCCCCWTLCVDDSGLEWIMEETNKL